VQVLGIDFGGSGIKGAPVDTATGRLLAPRFRLDTPEPATPRAVARAVARIVRHFAWRGPIGCGVPAVVRDGIVQTAANVQRAWIGTNAQALFSQATRQRVAVLNDADAAGYAEMTFGAGRGRAGLIVLVTLGTGIGTALFINGHLVPNTELGHLELDGDEAEARASAKARKREELSWKKWARRVDAYLQMLQRYFWPDLIIVGGGVSRQAEKFLPRLKVAQTVEIVAAQLQNDAGIVGAALAYEHAVQRADGRLALGAPARLKPRSAGGAGRTGSPTRTRARAAAHRSRRGSGPRSARRRAAVGRRR
jgi:polyphosphate glucokinase